MNPVISGKRVENRRTVMMVGVVFRRTEKNDIPLDFPPLDAGGFNTALRHIVAWYSECFRVLLLPCCLAEKNRIKKRRNI